MATRCNGMRRSIVVSSFVAFYCMLPDHAIGAAAAQDDSPGATQLEEVVVTAERRKDSLQTTPVAITTLDQQSLKQLGVYAVADADGVAPNINLVKIDKTGGGMEAFIRGIGTVETALTADPKIGIYVDDVYVSKTMASVFDIADIEQIQVLRGPQGTLFGRNTTGGAILVTTKKPSGEFDINAKASIGNDELRRLGVSVDLPAVSNIATKVSFYRMKTQGWAKNLYSGPPMPPADSIGKDLGSEDNQAWRVALRWTPLADVTVDYTFDRTRNRQVPMTLQVTALKDSIYNGFTTRPTPFLFLGGQLYQQMAALVSPHDRQDALYLDSQTESHLDVTAHTLNASWVHDKTTFKYVFGYRDSDTGYKGTDYGGAYTARDLFYGGGAITHVPEFSAGTNSKIRMTTHELQAIGSAFGQALEYVGGAFFYKEEVSQSQPQTFSIPIEFLLGGAPALRPAYIQAGFCGPIATPGPCIGTQRLPLPAADPNHNGLQDMTYGQDARSWAVYGQASYRLTSALKLSAGLRYTKDTRDAFLFNESLGQASLANRLQADDDWDNWSGMVNISYQLAPDKLLYAKYTTGYNSGMFNVRASTASGFLNPVGPEKVATPEVGLKSQWLNNRLRLNIAAFRNNYDDIQIAQFEAGTGGASQRIMNAGKGTYQGYELEVTAIPVRDLTLSMTYGYLDAKFKRYMQRDPATNALVDISSRVSVPFAPKHTASLLANYEFPRSAIGTFALSMAAQYKSQFEFDPIQTLYTTAGSRTLLSGRLTLRDIPISSNARDGSELEISLWGKNLADKEYRNFGTDFGSLGYAGNSFGTPRTYGLDVVYRLK